MKISLLKKPLFLIALLLSSFGAHAKVVCKPAHDALLQWRSSDRYIPGGVLRSELELFIKPETREGLAACSIEDILTQLEADKASLGVDRADAENLLKIRALNRHMASYQNPFKNFPDQPMRGLQDEIEGLPQSEIDALIASRDLLESNPDKKATTVFDFRTHMLIQQSFKHATDNDAYAFTVPGVLFALGMHKTAEVVMEVSTRGADLYPYMVAGGQDQIIDMLEQLHFERWQVEFLKQRVTRQFDVPDAFWEYLLNWRFKGEIRGVPTGTIVFPGEPLLQVITDPVSALIVESLINPWMSSMTNLLTAATRIMVAADGIPVTEAGTRRVATGRFSAYTAALAGAKGTSNMLMAYLLGAENYGTMPHATFGMFASEYDAFETIFKYAKVPVPGLPDTFDIETGIRTAIMAAGEKIGNVRQDSNVWSDDEGYLSTVKSAQVIADTWKRMGRGNVPSIITNDLRENTLAELAASGLNVAAASIGGGFAAPDVAHGNMVYKLVEFRDKTRGVTRFPIKIANGAKSTVPGLKDTVRLYGPDGKILKDINLRPEEEKPAGKVLQVKLWDKDGRAVKRATAEETPQIIAQGLRELPPHLVEPQARVTQLKEQGLTYPVEISQKLQDIVMQSKLENTPVEETRVLIWPGFFDPFTNDGHVAAMEWLDDLYRNVTLPHGFDQIVIVPARDSESASDKAPRLNQETRVAMLKYRFRDNPKVVIWEGEIHNSGKEAPRTYDTVRQIQKDFGKDSRIVVGMGEDTFWSIGNQKNKWKDAEALLKEFDFAVIRRSVNSEIATSVSESQRDTEALLRQVGFQQRPNRWISPEPGRQIQFLTNRELFKAAASSSAVRKFYDEQKISWVLHVTDPQWTFAMRSKLPSSTQEVDGALAVSGTELTINRIVPAVQATYASELAKVSISGDAHLPIELTDPQFNGEFHDPYNFPPHGMRDTAGPTGDAMISELDEVIPPMVRTRIPAHHEAEEAETGRKYLEMTTYDLAKIKDRVHDPRKVLHFEKNGPLSYSVFVNPRYEEYLKMIDPHKILPHFHNAWAMDFCTHAVTKRELELGYSVYIIIDAVAGVFPHTTANRLRELRALGARFVTTHQYLKLVKEWTETKATWSEVLNRMADFNKTNTTNRFLDAELKKPQYSGRAEDAALAKGPAVFQPKVRPGHMHDRVLEIDANELVAIPSRGKASTCETASTQTATQ